MIKPDWLAETSWTRIVRMADRLAPEDVAAAKGKLGELFHPTWASDGGLNHRVASLQITYAGRLVLLELAHAAVTLGIDEPFASRLRNPSEYLGAAAELHAGLLPTEAARRCSVRFLASVRGSLSSWCSGRRARAP